MPILRCQITLPGRSNIPEDQFVNTVHINTGTTLLLGAAADIGQAVDEMFNLTHDGNVGGNKLATYMSQFINRGACSVRVYNLSDAQPREPQIVPWTMAAGSNSQDLPEEVALCMSIAGAPPITARRRGRLYIGPLNAFALGSDFSEGGVEPSRPAAGALSCISAAAEFFHDRIDTLGMTWVIQSTVPSTNYVAVASGWCDNAWDTQRRRGVDPTSRRVWPTSV